MNRLNYISGTIAIGPSVLLMVSVFASCSSERDLQSDVSYKTKTRSLDINDAAHEDPALISLIELSGEKLRKKSEDNAKCEVSCISSELKSESVGSDCDTLAYVINYPDSGGFIIWANVGEEKSIVAYSYDSNFSIDNNPVAKYIEDYLADYCSRDKTEVEAYAYGIDRISAEGPLIRHYVEPVVKTELSGGYPFNSVVRDNTGSYSVGCVPVAAVTIVIHAEKHLIYNNFKYYFPDVIEYLQYGPGYTPHSANIVPIDPYILSFPKTYEGSTSAVARLMYDFGVGMNATYSSNDVICSGSDALEFLNEIGCVTTDNMSAFNERDVLRHLENGYLIFQEGIGVDEYYKYHAWVIDGCEYYTAGSTNDIVSSYFHCDWGRGDDSNGFYTGDVFAMYYNRKYRLGNYFAVKIKH